MRDRLCVVELATAWPTVQGVVATMTAISDGGVAHQSILLVPMSPAVGVIDRYRRFLDPSSRYDMPAHVTVLWPFMAPGLIDEDVLAELATLFAGIDSFAFELTEVRWFDRRVVYLAPEPQARFQALTAAVTASFPDYPPYEGAFDDVIPHVTVAADTKQRFMRLAGWLARRSLPITGTVTEIWLMTIGDVGPRYGIRRAFPLRPVRPA